MKRTPVNPWTWSLKFGYNQAEILEGITRQLVCAGQTSVDPEGTPQHPNDMRSQIELALENVSAVLSEAGMVLADITQFKIYTTDVDEALKHFDIIGSKLGAADVQPPMALLGVSRLAMSELLIEFEVTAAQ